MVLLAELQWYNTWLIVCWRVVSTRFPEICLKFNAIFGLIPRACKFCLYDQMPRLWVPEWVYDVMVPIVNWKNIVVIFYVFCVVLMSNVFFCPFVFFRLNFCIYDFWLCLWHFHTCGPWRPATVVSCHSQWLHL